MLYLGTVWSESPLFDMFLFVVNGLVHIIRTLIALTSSDISDESPPGHVAQSVACLATDTSLPADPEGPSSIRSRSHTFVEIDHEIISTGSFSFLQLEHPRRVVLVTRTKYWLTACPSLPRKKEWLGELTVPP